MRKTVVVLLMVLVAAPAMALVKIECQQVGVTNEVVISYDASGETEKVRAFALDIEVDRGAITAIDAGDPNVKDYYVYMGTIVIDVNGDISQYGSPVAPVSDPGAKGAIGTKAITVEMGSLYDPCDPKHQTAPPANDVLCKVYVSMGCIMTVTPEETFRGGVVLEDGSVAEVNSPGCDIYPMSWQYLTHCHGDATGDGSVNTTDFYKLLGSWYKNFPHADYNPQGDFTHDGQVNTTDFYELLEYWYKSVPGDCNVGRIWPWPPV